MRATYACQACGVRHACGPAHTAVNVQAAVNAQCFRRSLRFPCTQSHAAKGHRAGLRCTRRAVRQQGRAGSTATQYKPRPIAKLDSPEPTSQPAKAQEFAGLGAQRTLDFLAAWDQLALRLPPQAGMGEAAELILNALKLEVSHLPLPAESLQASTAASKALAVASQLADLSGQGFPLDAESIAAGILVDAVAAQRLSLDLVNDRLGSAVADLIEDIIKVRKLPNRVDLYDDVASSSLRELALTFYDTRAIVVEVVSRLVGMGTLVGTPQYARQLAALEALQIYAPLGHGLGLRPLCAQLEDSCFQELFPESYAETAAWLRREVAANGDSLAQCEQQLQQAVEQDPHFQSLAAGCQVAGRTKSLFSTMKKLLRLDSIESGGRAKQEVHDILASRCVVTPHPDLPPEQAEDLACQACYVVASKAVELFEELNSRRKDYIAQPKDNGYQSLHCTVKLPPVMVECGGGYSTGLEDEECLLKEGPTCELQIRTLRMHELAESGGAAHAAYKGGLDALQANRLQAWTHTLRALPPALSSQDLQPHEWSNQAAAAEQLFSHLDRDGDGYISVGEVAILLEELGIDVGQQGQGQGLGQLPVEGAGQKLLGALANKEPSRVNFEEFLQFNSQASLLGALPKVDTETAHSLRRSTSAAQEALPQASHTATPAQPSSSHLEDGSTVESADTWQDELPSTTAAEANSPSTDASSPSIIALHEAFKQSVQSRHASKERPQASASLASTSYSPLLSIPYTSHAQSPAASPPKQVSRTGWPSVSSSRVCCHATRPASRSPALPSGLSSSACISPGFGRLRNQARSAAKLGRALLPSHRTAGLSAAAFPGNGLGLVNSLSSSWRLHATGPHSTTAGIANSGVASTNSTSSGASAPSTDRQAPADTSATVEQALAEAAIIDRKSSHKQASSSSSSSSSEDLQDISSSDTADLLSTKHNESTLSLDLSSLPEPSSPSSLPPPQPMTKRSAKASSQQAPLSDSSDAAALLGRVGHNESTISLDLNNLPVPPELVQPPSRPRRPTPPDPSQGNGEPGLFPNLPNTLDWDDLQVEQPPRSSRPAPIPQPPSRKEGAADGSWDNLQPLFRPPPPPRERQEASNEAMAVDLMFMDLQNKRYKHVKGTSYTDATYALVPVDRKIGWRLSCDEEVTVNEPIHIPQHGPVVLGGDADQEATCDIILEGASEAGAAVHSRLEIFLKGRKPCCLLTCMGPSGTTYVNKTQLPRLVDTEVYLGDILSFGELTNAFQFVPIFQPERQKSAVDNALHYVEPRATAKNVPKDYGLVAGMVRAMVKGGTAQFPAARALLASSLLRDPTNAEGWAQLANMERRMTTRNIPGCSIPAARCFYRAAAELIQPRLDAHASPNGEAKLGSQRYRNLMAAMSSFIRVISSWAQLEFDSRNETPARRLYRRAADSVPSDPTPRGSDLQQPIKLLFKWAHQEFKTDNLFQSRELLHSLLHLEPDNTRALGMLGNLEWKTGRLALARQHFTAAIKADPNHVANLHSLARLELQEGHLQEARELFAKGQQLEPKNAYILQSWALAEAADGDIGLARDMLQKATTVQPGSVPCWHAWAKLELTAGNADKARELYLKALELNPRETLTHSALGALERKCGNMDLAIKYLNQALELTPRHPPACVEKAIVLRYQGKVNQAAKFTDMAVRESTQLDYKRGVEKKSANQFVRSSEPQQEDRKTHLQKKSQAQAKKVVATQKGKRPWYNKLRKKLAAKKKVKTDAKKEAATQEEAKLKAQQQAKLTAQAQASVPFERIVSVSE